MLTGQPETNAAKAWAPEVQLNDIADTQFENVRP